MSEKTTTKNKNKRMILLDAHAIIHRAYHALPDFASSKGEPTGALYGLSTMLLKIIKDLHPDYLIACYDLPKPTYRHEAYPEYKQGRKKPDEELISQMKRSKDVFTAFGIPIYSKEGFEADDVLGTIVEELKKNKEVDIVIASGDMDTMQLVNGKKVQVYTLKKGINDVIMYDEDAVRERFGFGPELLPDYKGLRGDPSDNIIGIKGIGEKTATDLILNFGPIEKMYKELKKGDEAFLKVGIKPRIIELLRDNEEEAVFSKMLATIRRDAPIDFKLPEKKWKDSFESEKAVGLFAELEFRTMGQRVKDLFAPTQSGFFKKEEPEGVDITDAKRQTSLNEAGDEHPSEEEVAETALALWVLDSNITNPVLEDILNFAKTRSFAKAKEIILGEVVKKGLQKVYADIEKPLTPMLRAMEKRGIKVDTVCLSKLSLEYNAELTSLEKEIWKQSGEEFNIKSPKQLGVVLFEKMGLKVKNQKKTGGGAMSTRESELEKMKDLHPIIGNILKYREISKLVGTYIDNIPALLDGEGRLHTTYLQTGTTTGRVSSQEPNLQNIPIKSELGRKIRNAFVTEKGWKLVAFDYSQIELRIASILSKDPILTKIFRDGGDIHASVASYVFGVKAGEVTKEMRRRAKVINFGILYGMGINALRANLGTDREEAQKFYNEYFKNFSGLAQYLDRIKSEAERLGYTETLFGRRRYFQGLKSKLSYIKASAERMAVNAPIQGTAADVLKIAMVRVYEYIKKNNLENDVFPLLQVHDELVCEIREEKTKEVAPEIRKIMENVMTSEQTGGVPIVANALAGDNWGEMEEIK